MKQPSQCDRVVDVLADGKWHSIAEIHERAGTMRLNSRVAELRARLGLTINCRRRNGTYEYRLVGGLGEGREEVPACLTGPRVASGDVSTDATTIRPSPSDVERLLERHGWVEIPVVEQLALDGVAA